MDIQTNRASVRDNDLADAMFSVSPTRMELISHIQWLRNERTNIINHVSSRVRDARQDLDLAMNGEVAETRAEALVDAYDTLGRVFDE